MIKFYEGGISYTEVMTMPFKTFLMFYDYMMWQMREMTEEGQKLNKRIERTDILKVFGIEGARYNRGKDLNKAFSSIKEHYKKS